MAPSGSHSLIIIEEERHQAAIHVGIMGIGMEMDMVMHIRVDTDHQAVAMESAMPWIIHITTDDTETDMIIHVNMMIDDVLRTKANEIATKEDKKLIRKEKEE